MCVAIHRGRGGDREVSAGDRYSKFEVTSDSEAVGRKRLNHSPDLHDLRRARDSLHMKFRKPTGSRPRVSKVHVGLRHVTWIGTVKLVFLLS